MLIIAAVLLCVAACAVRAPFRRWRLRRIALRRLRACSSGERERSSL